MVNSTPTNGIAIVNWGKPIQLGPKDWAPLIVAAVMLACAWFTIVLRLYTRIFMVFAFGWDDVFMILALFSFTLYGSGIINIVTRDGLLDHMAWVDLVSAVKGLMLSLVFYVVTITFLKISLGIFLLRIINQKTHKIIVYVVMAVSTVWGIVTTMVAIFQCGYPSSAGYYITRRFTGRCISGDTAVGIAYTHAVVSATTDIIFTTLPLFVLRDAQINRRAKYVLGGILILGGLGSVASLVRFVYVRDLRVVTTEFFFQAGNLSIWSTLECGLGISAGSLATLRPMFRKLLQVTKDTIGASSNKGTHNNQTNHTANTRYNNDSKRRSFIQRFSFHNKYQPHPAGGVKYSGEYHDPEAMPTHWGGHAVPMESISEKPHTENAAYVNVVSAVPKAVTITRPHGSSSNRDNWRHDRRRADDYDDDDDDEVTYAREQPGGRSRRDASPHSSAYSRSEHSREQQTWI